MNMDNDNIAKLEFIRAFHDEAEVRIDFLASLNKEKHRYEALTLCLSYIDSFAQWLYWPHSKSGKNFVDAIVNFGGNSLMGIVHPLQAIRSFESLNSPWQQISIKINEVFSGPGYELMPQDEFINKMTASLTIDESHKLRAECWRGTLAATAYYFLRNPSIHSFGAMDLSFSGTLYQGKPISGMGFMELHGILKNIHNELRRRSESNNQWFGNDKIFEIDA
jgi:hypothetical protein